MKKSVFLAVAAAFMLGGCATMDSAWESTKEASSDAYDWVFGHDEDKKDNAEK